MLTKIRSAILATTGTVALLAGVAPSAQAGLLSLAPGSCGQQESQPFASVGDFNFYVLVPGGSFEPGSPSWQLSGDADVVTGGAAAGTGSLSIPAGSSATSPATCTGIDHPSARLYVRNTGSSLSRLNVWATYPPVLGLLPDKVYLGQLSGTGTWHPSSPVQIGLLNNTVGSLGLCQTTISFTFAPADTSGNWRIDNVYLDPFHRI